MMERFCKNNEKLKGVIYIHKRVPSYTFHRTLKYVSGLSFKNFSIHFTLHQGLAKTFMNKMFEHTQLTIFKKSAEKKLISFTLVNTFSFRCLVFLGEKKTFLLLNIFWQSGTLYHSGNWFPYQETNPQNRSYLAFTYIKNVPLV